MRSEEKRERYLLIISGEANRLTRLINNVLNFSNQGNESDNLRFQKIDLARVIRDILKNLSVGLEEKGFKIKTSGLEKPCWVEGGEERVFEQFYRSELSVKKGIQGSGLGLTLSQKMIEAHQGRMIAKNRNGGPSQFIPNLAN